jgi:hypothetical protein
MRVCINYIPLNAISVPVLYDVPLADVMFNRITLHRFFTKIDIKDAYGHIELQEENRYATAFHTPFGDYEYCRLPFGWAPSPAYFQKYMHWVLKGLLVDIAYVFQDDIAIFSHTLAQHVIHVRLVESALRRAGLQINHEKSLYHKTTFIFIGVRLSHNRISAVDPAATLRNWPQPRSFRALQRWLGTINQFRPFIPSLSVLTLPFDQREGHKWQWMEHHSKSFQRLNAAAARSIALAPHRPHQPQTLTVDASLLGLGVILEENRRPIAIASRRLTTAESNYDTTERELLAIVWALEHLWHLTIAASSILIRSDHKNLVDHLRPSATQRRRNRWLERLMQFNVQWEFIPGIRNPADGPSRLWDESHRTSPTTRT